MVGIGVAWVIAAASLGADPHPQRVAGGEDVAVCGFPTVVRMQGNCSGTLIHPQVVMTAAHCGPSATVTLGEDVATGTAVAVQQCLTHPLWEGEPGGTDLAICTLVEPVDLPIVPILMGCEQQLLAEGVQVTSVGFGDSPEGPNGIKRAVTYPITAVFFPSNVAQAGAPGAVLCAGDSGGGTFVQYLDGSWRVFGVNDAVAGTPCVSGDSVLAMMAAAVPWIEGETGYDVSPCHDADGNWDPNAECDAVPLDPVTGGGAWPACETGPLSGPLSSCGPPVAGPDDLAAPSIAIATPSDGEQFDLDPLIELAAVEVTITADDADGWGIAETWLEIDGVMIGGSEDGFPPWEVPPLQFEEGVFELVAKARDWNDNVGSSAPVQIVVGDPPMGGSGGESSSSAGADDTGGADETSGGGGDAGSSSGQDTPGATGSPAESGSEGESGGDTEGPAAGGDGGEGCGCHAERSARPASALLLLLLACAGRSRSPRWRRRGSSGTMMRDDASAHGDPRPARVARL